MRGVLQVQEGETQWLLSVVCTQTRWGYRHASSTSQARTCMPHIMLHLRFAFVSPYDTHEAGGNRFAPVLSLELQVNWPQ
jgi:hypothetical protein